MTITRRTIFAVAGMLSLLALGPALTAGSSPMPPSEGGVPGARGPSGEGTSPEELGATPLPRGPDVPGILSSPYMDYDRNRIFDNFDADLAAMGDDDVATAIVLFTSPVTDETVAALRDQVGDFELNAMWTIIDGLSAQMTKRQVLALSQLPVVVQIEKDMPVSGALGSSARASFGADAAVSSFGVTGDRTGNNKGFSKTDVVVCVVDSGYDVSHPDLNEGQLLGWMDYVNGQPNAYDDHGHGTHVASIIAGQGDGAWANRGVAYGAAMVAVKVFDSTNSGTTTNTVSGFNFCVNNKSVFGIKILNYSGGSNYCNDGTDSMAQAANSAYTNGLLPVIASGNSGPGTCTVNSPGTAANALTVCNMRDTGATGFRVAQDSSRGPTADGRVKPDVCGPGTQITAARAGSSPTQYVEMSGTSMATPFVSGIAALMLDGNYALTPAQLKSTIKAQTHDWAATGADSDVGSGRLLGFYAVKSGGGFTGGTPPGEPNHWQVTGETMHTSTGTDQWEFTVQSTSWPLAVNLIIPSASSTKDFNLHLWRWTGTSWVFVTDSLTTSRQETVGVTPQLSKYAVLVTSSTGTGNYYIDFSHVGTAPVLTFDQ